MVFSSTRIAAKGSSLFISFQRNHKWSTPIYMGDTVSAAGTNNIEARLSPDHRTLYFSSTRVVPAPARQTRVTSEKGLARMEAWDNGLANIWQVSLKHWLDAAGQQ
jgi:hypothetical protein